MTRRIAPTRRAFATTTALFLVVFVGAALVATTNLMLADARRTTHESIDAQLLQLLRTGAIEAMHQAGDPRLLEVRLIKPALPEELTRQGGSLRIELRPRGKARIDAQTDAGIAGRKASQILVLHHTGAAWVIESAQLR